MRQHLEPITVQFANQSPAIFTWRDISYQILALQQHSHNLSQSILQGNHPQTCYRIQARPQVEEGLLGPARVFDIFFCAGKWKLHSFLD